MANLEWRSTQITNQIGGFFIDRSPEAFSTILHYMRTKKLFFKSPSAPDYLAELGILLEEAKFFKVSNLVKLLQELIEASQEKAESPRESASACPKTRQDIVKLLLQHPANSIIRLRGFDMVCICIWFIY